MQDSSTPPAAGSASVPLSGPPLKLTWVPPTGLLALSFANFFLRIITLGIYNFWGKTEIRRRVWSAIRLDGEPLSYTGTGKELFLGFLVIMALVFLPVMLLTFGVIFMFGPESPAVPLFQICLYLFFFFLTGVAIYRAQRYRLSRTNWRGIRGSLVGSDRSFAWHYCWTGFLVPMTMGWILPWRSTSLQQQLTNDMRFGDRAFSFDAEPGPLYGPFAVFWVGAAVIIVVTMLVMGGATAAVMALGGVEPGAQPDPMQIAGLLFVIYGVMAIAFLFYYLLSAWYRARQINHFAKHTHFEGAKLVSTVSGSGLIWIAIGNFMWRIAGLLLGVVLLGVLAGIVGAIMGPESFSGMEQPSPDGQPPVMGIVAIFGSIIVLAAAASLFGPIIQARNARYLVDNLAISGHVPLASIAQGADQGIKRGEGLAQAFDVDAF